MSEIAFKEKGCNGSNEQQASLWPKLYSVIRPDGEKPPSPGPVPLPCRPGNVWGRTELLRTVSLCGGTGSPRGGRPYRELVGSPKRLLKDSFRRLPGTLSPSVSGAVGSHLRTSGSHHGRGARPCLHLGPGPWEAQCCPQGPFPPCRPWAATGSHLCPGPSVTYSVTLDCICL